MRDLSLLPPGRVLDWELAYLEGWRRKFVVTSVTGMKIYAFWTPDKQPCMQHIFGHGTLNEWIYSEWSTDDFPFPHYSTSIDDALTLVTGYFELQNDFLAKDDTQIRWKAHVALNFDGVADTPAMAICLGVIARHKWLKAQQLERRRA